MYVSDKYYTFSFVGVLIIASVITATLVAENKMKSKNAAKAVLADVKWLDGGTKSLTDRAKDGIYSLFGIN